MPQCGTPAKKTYRQTGSPWVISANSDTHTAYTHPSETDGISSGQFHRTPSHLGGPQQLGESASRLPSTAAEKLPNLNKGNAPSLPTTMEAGQGADGMGWDGKPVSFKESQLFIAMIAGKQLHSTLQFGVQNHLSIWPSTESSLCLIQQANNHNHPARVNSQ